MRAAGVKPNTRTYNTGVRALCFAGRMEAADALVAAMEVAGSTPNRDTFSMLIYVRVFLTLWPCGKT